MITLSLLAACAVSPYAPVDLGRVFKKGEKLTYHVASVLNAERRGGELRTWMPEDLNVDYDFTLDVQDVKADGFANLHYQRPKMTITEGETFDQKPKAKTEKVNYDLLMTVSPINEIVDFKDIAKKPPTKKGFISPAASGDMQIGGILGQFVSEIYRLSLFTGSFESALDFSPRLRAGTLNVGDTWLKTVGYSPQKKKNNKKTMVQRLDYNYTYKGPVTLNGKKFERVEADLDLNTDLGEFINDTFEVTSEDTGIRKLPLQLKAHIVWNLDPVTHDPLFAEATSTGGYQIYIKELGDDTAILEERIKGRTTLSLTSRKR